jgi:hypothetical protein
LPAAAWARQLVDRKHAPHQVGPPPAAALTRAGVGSPVIRSSRRSRRPSRRAFSTRFSSRRNAIVSSCSRCRHPHSTAMTN